jgi:outer membrane lipoprotein-sorting protein
VVRDLVCACLALVLPGTGLAAQELPAWWRAFPGLARMESPFVQQSESAVFGKLSRQGQLRMAKGGRLRVEYRRGILLVADGRTLTQYDPEARTAQRLLLSSAAGDTPLLNILLNPGALAAYYDARSTSAQSLTLEPRQAGLPRVELTGQGGLPRRIQWQDGTGATQVIEFTDPRIPAQPFDPATFTFQAPAGTRWLGRR